MDCKIIPTTIYVNILRGMYFLNENPSILFKFAYYYY